MLATVVALYNTRRGSEEPRTYREGPRAITTAAPLQPAAPHRGIKALLVRYSLTFYFIIAYAGTWLVELPYVLSEYGARLLPFSSPLLKCTLPLSIFTGPFLSAFIMTGVSEGRAGVGRFLRRFVLWRVDFLRWYLFVFVGIPVIAVLSVVVLPGVLGSFQGLSALAPTADLARYLCLHILLWRSAWLVLVALTRGRLGYRPDAEATLTDATGVPHVR